MRKDGNRSPIAVAVVLAAWAAIAQFGHRTLLALFIGALAVLAVPLGRVLATRSQAASDLMCGCLFVAAGVAAVVASYWLMVALAVVLAYVFIAASRRNQSVETIADAG